MKQAFIFVLGVLMATAVPHALLAQDIEVDLGNEGGHAVLVATVNFESASLTQDGDSVTVQFGLSNRERVQPGVRYGLVLVGGEGENAKTFDQKIWDETLTLRAGESMSRTVSYTLPPLVAGTYEVFVVSENLHGLRFGTTLAGQVTVSEGGRGFAIDPASCYLTSGEGGSAKRLLSGDVVAEADAGTVVGHCEVRNLSERSEEVVPSVYTYERSLFGTVVSETVSDAPVRTISGRESALVSVSLPKVAKPQAYVSKVSFGDLSSTHSFEYVVGGTSATVQSVLFDKDLYESGDQAEVTLFWSGSADSVTTLTNPVIQAEIRSGESSCGTSHMKSLGIDLSPRVTFTIPITSDCENPTLSVSIIDGEEGEITKASFVVESSSSLNDTGGLLEDSFLEEKPIVISASVVAAVLALIVLLFYAVSHLRGGTSKNGEKVVNSPNIPPTVGPSVFALLLLGGFALIAPQASADTFYVSSPTEVYEVTANLNKTSYTAGESIDITGGIQVASCACSESGTMLSLRYNINPVLVPYTSSIEFLSAFTYDEDVLFATSTPAPSALGPHRIYIVVQTDQEYGWIYIPFTVDTTGVVPCEGRTVLNCVVPPLASAGSGGSCQSGYYGTCSYTCGTGGALKENYNSCAFVRPDLASPDIMPLDGSSPSPSGGAEYSTIDTITFSGFAVNSNAKWIHQAGWAELEIENTDTSVVTTVNAYGGFELGSFARNQVKDLTYSTTLPEGEYRYRFVVDTDNDVDESNESNNASSWFDFTVVDAGIPCPAATVDTATVQDCDLPLTAEGNTAGSCALGYTGACSYSCAAGSWTKVSNTCSQEYDLISIATDFDTNVFNMGDTFDLKALIVNNSVHRIDEGHAFEIYVEIERISPNPQTWFGGFFTYAFDQPGFYVLEPGWAFDKTISMTIPGSFDSVTYFNEAGDYRYRITADQAVYNEPDYDNNVSPWVYFTVAEESACPDTVISGCDVPVNSSANNGCATGYVGSCDYTCDVVGGSWVEVNNTCTPPLINLFEVCDADGVSNCTSGAKSVNPGEILTIKWDADASQCLRVGGPADFTTGGLITGTDQITSDALPLQSDVYTVSCTYDDVLTVEESITVNTTGVSPVLQSSASIVNVGDDVTLTWDTNNTAAGGESACTLTGGGIDGTLLQTNGGDPELGSAVVEIKGRSTFVLRCDPSLDAAVVEIFPVGLEG
jgi:hypothetical protein